MSALPKFTMRELLEAGVHFGHKTMRWNPRMEPYIFGTRHNIHIIDLQQTVPFLHRALEVVRDVASKNGRVLFVGTKHQASSIIADSAKRCGQYYINHRWLGGMLTNWNTVSASIKTLRKLESQLEDPELVLSKKERLQISRQLAKLEASLGGIKDMGGIPDLLFIIDTNKEKIAIQEARKLGIPIVAVVDTNCNPENVDHLIPGNDDATKSIQLYCNLVSDAILSGIESALVKSGDDAGAKTETPAEQLPDKVESKGGKGDKKVKVETKKFPKKAGAKVGEEKKEDKKPAKETVAKEEKPKEAKAKKSPAKKAADKSDKEDKKAVEKKPATKKAPAKKAEEKKTAPKKTAAKKDTAKPKDKDDKKEAKAS